MCRIAWAHSRGGAHTSSACPSPVAGRNLRLQHAQRKQAKGQAFQASGLRHLGIFLPPWETFCESFNHPESSFNPPLSPRHTHRPTGTMADLSVALTSHCCQLACVPTTLTPTVMKMGSSNSSEGESNTLKKRVC